MPVDKRDIDFTLTIAKDGNRQGVTRSTKIEVKAGQSLEDAATCKLREIESEYQLQGFKVCSWSWAA